MTREWVRDTTRRLFEGGECVAEVCKTEYGMWAWHTEDSVFGICETMREAMRSAEWALGFEVVE